MGQRHHTEVLILKPHASARPRHPRHLRTTRERVGDVENDRDGERASNRLAANGRSAPLAKPQRDAGPARGRRDRAGARGPEGAGSGRCPRPRRAGRRARPDRE
jgi:hypothetical protein